ncbi:MAG: hypothetical protein HY268_27855 [Deltaproteobacteria bacterium]|nr:hypothetical protein [Deltaproteobacteria bacterium]
MADWQRWIQAGIIRSSRLPWIRTVYRKACQLATWEVGRQLASLPGVEAVYARQSHPRSVTFAPGQSDLDLTLVLDDSAAEDGALVHACTHRVDALNRVFYFVLPRDARFVTRRELAQLEAWPGAAEILSTPSAWVRIGGREVRRPGKLLAIESKRIPLHPEFNAWWLNVLQTYALTPQTGLAEGHMRLCVRVAMKNQLHLQVGRGRIAPPAQPYLSDAEATTLFAEDAEMLRLLGDLERQGFWAQDAEERKARILHRSLALAAEFYRELSVPCDAAWVAPAAGRSAAITEAHRSALRDRLDQEEALRSIAASIIVYPTPHWAACEYQIDVLLHDDVPPADVGDAVRAIRRSLGGRTFGIAGTHAQLTLVPRSVFEHPWYFLGTPFPFLHDHVASFAETLCGSPPRIPVPPSSAERLSWCARYYLFHRFTLHYRPRYVSKDCNFCQLAAIRLFLEHGAVLTDGAQVRRAYLDAFVKPGEESQALDFLLRGNGEGLDERSFAAALQFQSREYDTVEALLRRQGVLA